VEFPTKKLRELLADLDARIPFFGIESLLPALHEGVELPLELVAKALGDDGFTLVLDEPDALPREIADVETDYASHHRQALARADLCFEPRVFLASAEEIEAQMERHPRVELVELDVEGGPAGASLEVRTEPTSLLRQDILRETMK